MTSKLRSAMTPAELAAVRAHDRATRKSRAKTGAQPIAKLTDLDRWHIALLGAMQLWPKTQVAAAYGISPRTVIDCMNRHGLAPRRNE